MVQPLLFNRVDIFFVMEHQKGLLKQKLLKLSQKDLQREDKDLVAELSYEFGINVPLLLEDELYATTRETQLDVSRSPNRMFFDNGPHYVPATEVTVRVPFVGDAALFDVQPTSFTLSPPRGKVVGSELHLIFTLTDQSTDIKPHCDAALRAIKQYLDNLKPSAAQLKDELDRMAAQGIAERKRQLESHKSALSTLGIPIRTESDAVTPTSSAAKPAPKKAPEVWDVFISHASEDKEEIARPLYEALKSKGVSIWFDEFTLKLGDSLRGAIDKGLARSKYGVVILSKHFFEKHWPTQELNGLATREVNGKKVILPIWHKVTHDDVAGFSPTLADRLAIATDKGLEKIVNSILDIVQH
jgi:hypothetical protein